ncbi:MAG: ECF transporter S component [Erysipelotrichaceae bacterium]|nr:ECF transporter S component [Erysipelotrichaceae bacterium]
MRNKEIRKLAYAALFLALGLVLPFVTGQIPEIGSMLCPMHLPVMLCGLLCGPYYGALVGAICPVLRSLMFGMPPMYPGAIAMAFELCAYGLVIGLVYRMFRKKNTAAVYCALLVAMVLGRIVWGIARYVMMAIKGGSFTMAAFISGAITTAIPGIILQLVLIPLIMYLLKNRTFD